MHPFPQVLVPRNTGPWVTALVPNRWTMLIPPQAPMRAAPCKRTISLCPKALQLLAPPHTTFPSLNMLRELALVPVPNSGTFNMLLQAIVQAAPLAPPSNTASYPFPPAASRLAATITLRAPRIIQIMTMMMGFMTLAPLLTN